MLNYYAASTFYDFIFFLIFSRIFFKELKACKFDKASASAQNFCINHIFADIKFSGFFFAVIERYYEYVSFL